MGLLRQEDENNGAIGSPGGCCLAIFTTGAISSIVRNSYQSKAINLQPQGRPKHAGLKKETLFTLSFPAKAHTNQKLHSGQQATKDRKSGKKKKSPEGLERGIRQASSFPPPKQQGRESKPRLLNHPDPRSPVARADALPSLPRPPLRQCFQDAGR